MVERTYKLICKKCGSKFDSKSTIKNYCNDCENEMRTLTCVKCGKEYKYQGKLSHLPKIPICDNCYEELPRIKTMGKNPKNMKDSICICGRGHIFRTTNTAYSIGNGPYCPVCIDEVTLVKCEICGKDYHTRDRHIDRIKNGKTTNVCDDCAKDLPGEGITIRKCYTCGAYFKTTHNFNNCPVCNGISIAPRKITCKRCGKEFLTRNKAAEYCPDCKHILSLSPAVKSFKELLQDENNVRIDDIFMMPIPDVKPKKGYKICERCGREFPRMGPTQRTCNHCFPILRCDNCGEEYLGLWGKMKKLEILNYHCCSKSCSTSYQMTHGFGHDVSLTSMEYKNKDFKSIKGETKYFKEINNDNFKEFDINGIWIITDENGIILNIHWTTNVSNEYKNGVWKYNRNYGKDKWKAYFVYQWDTIEEGLMVELYIYLLYGAKYWHPAPGDQQKLYKELMTPETRIITWENLHIGDTFLDGSVAEYIQSWEYKDTFEIVNSKMDSIIVSEDHLLSVDIFDESNNRMNPVFMKSADLRLKLDEESDEWICASDIFDAINKGYVVVIDGENIVESCKKNSDDKSLVRCISTNTGKYQIASFLNHNCARKLYYGLSDIYMMEESCNSDGSNGILGCTCPGGICRRCAEKSGMGRVLKQLTSEQKDGTVNGIKIGGLISSNATEPLTQLYLDAVHSSSSNTSHTNIVNTFDCFSKSPIIQQAAAATTTKERRQIISDGLKNLYKENGVEIDGYNIEIIAKKMTSYKRTPSGLRLINEDKGELCDIVSINSIGGSTRNIYKKAALGKSFATLSRGGDVIMTGNDSFEDIFRDIL